MLKTTGSLRRIAAALSDICNVSAALPRWLAAGLLGGALAVFAGVPIPETLPRPDGKPGDPTKPVQVYIMSGQSNMVGMGEIGPMGQTCYSTYVASSNDAEKGCIVFLYSGAYDPAVDYDTIEPVETHHANVGYWPHQKLPSLAGPCTQIARGYIRIAREGVYSFQSGDILELDGEVIHRRNRGGDPDTKRVTLKPGTYPIKIIHFGNGETNVTYSCWDVPGTLFSVVKTEGKFPNLVDDKGNWSVRHDVIYKGVISAVAQGPLTPGMHRDKTIGPELGFGHVMGYYHDAPVLLLKVSYGTRSLGWDILPPGSERFTHEGKVYAGYKDVAPSWPEGTEPKPTPNWYAGKQYDEYVAAIHDVLNNFDKLFPDFKGQGFEIAGFVWWQGYRDGGDAGHISRYEQNLANLIKAWRKEFDAPNAPWAIAGVGFGGAKMTANYVKILEAQMAVADAQRHPEFAGTVKTIDVRPFWRDKAVSPQAHDYHYNRNAETAYLVGEWLGRAMVELKEKK